MSFTISFNGSAVKERIEGVNKRAISLVANEALKDANYYCREDTGMLEKSSILASQPEQGLLIWDTPYAARMYYTGTPLTGKNPNASLLWAQKSAGINREKYQRMIQAILDGG